MPKHPPLSSEQLNCVKNFAARHGRRWKSVLRDDWFSGRQDVDSVLYGLRNSHGPEWLNGFRLPA